MTDNPRFVVVCPRCGGERRQGFTRGDVEPLLRGHVLRFYCIECDFRWHPSEDDVVSLREWVLEAVEPRRSN